MMKFEPYFSAKVGQYCPPINGKVNLSLDGKEIGSVTIDKALVSEATDKTAAEAIVVSYAPGRYCATLELNAGSPD
jgi:hypothetical protein